MKAFSIPSKFLSKIIVLLGLLLSVVQVSAQEPEQDCINAIPICQETYSETNAYQGEGIFPNEIDAGPSCLGSGEKNCVWYIFTVQTSGLMCFTIDPNTGNDDYDWAVYDLTNNDCEDIFTMPELEVSCNYSSNVGCGGDTGPNGNTTGGCGGQNEECVLVNAGETYVINVSQFTDSSQDGYTIDFTESTAQILDDVDPYVAEIQLPPLDCGMNAAAVIISENVLCAGVDENYFVVSGPGGPYSVTNAFAKDCALGGQYDDAWEITFSPPITLPGEYTFSVTNAFEDNCGNLSDFPVDITFDIATIDFEGSVADVEVCEGGNSTITVTGTAPGIYNWYNVDVVDPVNLVGTGTSFDPIDLLTPDVALSLYVTYTNSSGCTSETQEVQALIASAPQSNFTSTISTDCTNHLTVDFTNSTMVNNMNVGAVSYFWIFGDPLVSGSSLADPSFTYPDGGNYEVMLISFYAGTGCARDTFTSEIFVPYPPIEAAFEIPEFGCEPLDISVSSTNTAVDYFWDFGDATTAMGASQSHTYSTSGTYSIQLIVNDPLTCNGSDTIAHDVEVFANPVVDFNTSENGCSPLEVEIEALDQTYATYTWDLGDGSSSSDPSFTHTYSNIGEYIITLEAVTTEGCSGQATRTIEVIDIPEIGFTYSPTNPEIGTPVQFTFTASENPNMDYNWELGDGSLSSDLNPEHTYAEDGTYDVCLQIQSPLQNCENMLCQSITVFSPSPLGVPSVFTPNGDGLNDIFTLEGYGLNNLDFKVFNRWGYQVFHTNSLEYGWDGTHKGELQEMDTYVYILEATTANGETIRKQGNITLIR